MAKIPSRADSKIETSSKALKPDALRHGIEAKSLGFTTTDDLDPTVGLIGQERALSAIRFGAGIKQPDFNLFVLGPPGSGKTTAVKNYLQTKADGEKAPNDWVYVNNFKDPNKPKAIELPRGRAAELTQGMIDAISELSTTIPAMFESDDFQSRRRIIEEEFRATQDEAFEALNQKAISQNVALMRTPTGFVLAPSSDGKVVKPEVFNDMPATMRDEIEGKIELLQSELQEILEQLPRLDKERRAEIREVTEDIAGLAISQTLSVLKQKFNDTPDVLTYLSDVNTDLIKHVEQFMVERSEEGIPATANEPTDLERDARFRRYMVNSLVSAQATHNSEQMDGAPIIEELNPNYGRLIGRSEHIAHMGTLVTDFMLLKAGALHRANGGYLLIDAIKLLTNQFAWEALKRAMREEAIRIEVPSEMSGVISTQTLDPDPIPLTVKVVLFGDHQLYYRLSAADPEFEHFFKVQADFDDTIDRTTENNIAYAGLIASIVKKHDLKPVDASGVARMIERGSRMAADNQKLSVEIGKLADIIREADYWASDAGHNVINRNDIARAIEESTHRADRLRDKGEEMITRNIIHVDTDGATIGQINGLSVLSLGNLSFGKPTRITASVRMGEGRVTDIEREVDLGGPIHTKGVMILWGYLAGQYATDMPFSLAASLVFEQSYGGVDGDSASSTELYCLLSALSEVPIKQGFAVTGAVNQKGQVQAIGGVNEKIEGFFDLCKTRGLTGEQGVLIPASNVQHLMLREDIVQAVRDGKFAIYDIATINEGIEVLTGISAGERDANGKYPVGSINRAVEDRLVSYAIARQRFGSDPGRAANEEDLIS